MPDSFAIESVAVPMIAANYFTDPWTGQNGITPAQLLDRIVSLGANDVRLIGTFGQLSDPAGNAYSPFQTQSVASLRVFTDDAHARGLAITWNPITLFANGVIAGDNTQDSHLHPTDPAAWFASYRLAVLEQAGIAEAIGAARYAILSDIEQFVFLRNPDLADEMVALIGEVRGVYHGQITSVLWSPDGALSGFPVEILKALDLVGLGLFPHLTEKTDPTLAELQAAFHHDAGGNDIIANLIRLQADLGKPMWLSDLAQSSYDGWLRDNPQKFDPTVTFTPDNTEQVLGYKAFFNEMLLHGAPWFQGVSVQNIQRVDVFPQVQAYFRGPAGEDFWGKPGEQVLRDYFTGQVAIPTLEIHGTNYGETVRGGSFGEMILYAGQADQILIGGAKNDTFVASSMAKGAPVHELKLALVGSPVAGVLPTFTLRINGQSVPVDYDVTVANGTAPATLTVPIFEVGPITSIELITTNWVAGADYNRYLRVADATLDGVALPTATYHPNFGAAEAFTGDTNRGGYVSYNTNGMITVASGRMDLLANSRIDGGAGVDTVIYAGNAADYAITRAGELWSIHKPGAAAGEGTDTLANVEMLRFADKTQWVGANLDASATAAGQNIDLAAGHSSSVILGGVFTSLVSLADGGEAHGGAGGDILHGGNLASRLFGGAGADTISGGGAAANYLRGDDGNDSIVGGAGFDDINGNMGNDTASGGPGDDWVVGGKDNDLLNGDDGDDIVYGNLGDDWCDGGAGDDLVRGGRDNDVILGQAGNDWLSGDRGDDTMTGGPGADIFHTFGDADLDRVTDFNAAEGDRVQLDPGTIYTLAQVGADTVISMTGGGQMVLVGVQLSSLPSGWIFGA